MTNRAVNILVSVLVLAVLLAASVAFLSIVGVTD